MTKNLAELRKLLAIAEVKGDLDKMIRSVVVDSRKVTPGSLFICLSGLHADGHNYVEQAFKDGAVAVLAERTVPEIPGLTVIEVPDTRKAMQRIAPYFFDYPGRKLRMIGVTGTNGKTTTTYLLKKIFEQAGHKVGLIGTIQIMIGERVLPIKNTTPDVLDLQTTLAMMVEGGMEYVVMEVSSHALALDRVAGCEFDVGVFTNLTRDHLDFHQTFENYLAAKARLFDSLTFDGNVKQGKTAIVNLDDPAGQTILEHSRCRTITYGIKNNADLQAAEVEVRADGSRFKISGRLPMELQLKLTGNFNVYNALGAVGAALAEGISPAVIKETLEEFASVDGRFELVNAGQPFAVIVDYAHTPDGLENILRTAQEFTKGKIIVVFGCGGDRDRTKRPIMGRLAAEYGDVILATSDNPRSEEPEAILAEVEQGIRDGLKPGKEYRMLVQRREAIETAIKMARPGDTVLIAGKGHETYQILKDRTIDFDDRQVARDIIREMK